MSNADDLCQAVNVPKFILISRKMLADTPEKVQEALRATPVEGVFVCSELDAMLAQGLSANVMGFHQPFAIVAEFPFEIGQILEGGKVEVGKLPELPIDPITVN